jgi:hypothetical protein
MTDLLRDSELMEQSQSGAASPEAQTMVLATSRWIDRQVGPSVRLSRYFMFSSSSQV